MDHPSAALVPQITMTTVGHYANTTARQYLFQDHRERLTIHTRKAHDRDLHLFATYLHAADTQGLLQIGEFATDPDAWQGITWGVIQGFREYQKTLGYAIASINRQLATVKRYARLASLAGVIAADELRHIDLVQGYRRVEGQHIDETRRANDAKTRLSERKIQPTRVNVETIARLKRQPDTLQGWRDALLICLLGDHGLRIGEIAPLTVEAFDLVEGTFTFYRPKVDKTQIHRMTQATYRTLIAYQKRGGPTSGPLWISTHKGGGQVPGRWSVRAMQDRIAFLGKKIGIDKLSPHDLRHAWATIATKAGTNIKDLQEAGGWSSLTMPARYQESNAIANEGVKLIEPTLRDVS